jgi:glycine oxidase
MPRSVVIVGAGLIGSSIAWELAQAGAEVTVLERSVPGAEASTVAAGILAPRIEHPGGPLLALGLASLEGHARWAEKLAALGLETGWRRSGLLQVALDDAAAEELSKSGGKIVDGAEARRLEPALSPAVKAARVLDHEAQTEPPRLLRALLLAAERAGARFVTGTTVDGVVRDGDRVAGVSVAGEVLRADVVVIAAGSWTGQVGGLPPALARTVRPVRGQLLHLDTRRPLLSRIVFGGGAYVVPRLEGRVVVGATMEEAGFSRTVTLGGAADVASRALRSVPALREAELVSHAVNFRPAPSDELPLIGHAGPGLVLATGHFRNGILLAPATAELVADQILERVPRHDGAAFDPRRFEAAL